MESGQGGRQRAQTWGSFAEAETVFSDDHALLLDDPDHSSGDEERFVLPGLSAGLRVLIVVPCYRAPTTLFG
jgi:uncharacterized protein